MISVCMATYNGAEYIRAQVGSILGQISNDDELIISDDSSMDGTPGIIEQLGDNRIRLFRDNHFQSPVLNFEHALKQASGETIFLSDQDDLWAPNKVHVMTEILKTCDLAVSDCDVIDASGRQTHPSFYAKRHSGPGLFKNIYKNTYLGCCMAFRAEVLDWALPFPKDVPMHDMWLGTIAEMFGKTRFCPDVLVHYRRHCKNASSTYDPSPYSVFQKMQFRLVLIQRLFERYRQRKAAVQ